MVEAFHHQQYKIKRKIKELHEVCNMWFIRDTFLNNLLNLSDTYTSSSFTTMGHKPLFHSDF